MTILQYNCFKDLEKDLKKNRSFVRDMFATHVRLNLHDSTLFFEMVNQMCYF